MKRVTLTDEQHETLVKLFRHRVEATKIAWKPDVPFEQAMLDAITAAEDVS